LKLKKITIMRANFDFIQQLFSPIHAINTLYNRDSIQKNFRKKD